jgi:hypothetical protein
MTSFRTTSGWLSAILQRDLPAVAEAQEVGP